MNDQTYKSLISAEDKLKQYRFEKNEKFIPENVIIDKITEHFSDSGKYILTITPYKTGSKTWNYTLGKIYAIVNEKWKLIAEIQRNYSSFPFVFVENHANGHDYLICGEDYQGQTIIELDTGKINSRVPVMGGFCWANMKPSPSTNLLAVDGCYWACGYEYKIYDFSDPMNLPFDCLTENLDMIMSFDGWNADDSCNICVEYDTRKSDNKPISKLTEKEEDELANMSASGLKVYSYESKNLVWKKQ